MGHRKKSITSGEIQREKSLGRRNRRPGSPTDSRSPNEAIIIVPDENPFKGSCLNDPIEIDDEAEFLGIVEKSRGSNRKSPILVEQEGIHRPWVSSFLPQRQNRSRPFKKTSMEASVYEIGESSGISLQEKLKLEMERGRNCEICTESKYWYELFAIEGCSHSYCKSCVGQYVAAKVEENVPFIKCPDPNCIQGRLEPAMCSQILEAKVFDRWSKALCELMVNNKFYCPFKDCSALMNLPILFVYFVSVVAL